MIQNQSVVVGGNLAVECKAAASEPPEFNLVQYLPNGSEIPVKIGGKIKRRLPKQQEVYFVNFIESHDAKSPARTTLNQR